MSTTDSSSGRARTALAAGATLAGTYAGLRAARWWHRQQQPPPSALRPALDWAGRPLETRYGRAHCYVRPGTGPPVVLLHSFNAAASSYELKPVAEHLARTTDRPLYALDWLGFGKSARPAIEYRPPVYGHQLYRALTDLVPGPADLVALSLGCEYAAWMGLQAAPQVRRLVLLAPTGLTRPRGPSAAGQFALSLADQAGLFDLFFTRLTRRASLQSYYERQVFLNAAAVPSELVDYAVDTTRVRGAHHAPLQFVRGRLYLDAVAQELYGRLYRPALLLTPSTPGPTVQQFDLLPSVLDQNPRSLSHQTLPGGLLPHWEAPTACFESLDAFLAAETPES